MVLSYMDPQQPRLVFHNRADDLGQVTFRYAEDRADVFRQQQDVVDVVYTAYVFTPDEMASYHFSVSYVKPSLALAPRDRDILTRGYEQENRFTGAFTVPTPVGNFTGGVSTVYVTSHNIKWQGTAKYNKYWLYDKNSGKEMWYAANPDTR